MLAVARKAPKQKSGDGVSDRPTPTNSTNISESFTSLEKNRRSHSPSLLLMSLVNSCKTFFDLVYIKLGYLP
ncbi:MAG: hypothetical protein AAGJ08_09450 [Cyanobacteria bacterium P01_H01_bin.35]